MKKRLDVDVNRDSAALFLSKFFEEKRLKERLETEDDNQLSHKFSTDFKEVLLRCFGNTKVQAETVYMQYMLKKGNVHILKTRWKTLEDFVKYQGRLGIFLVEYSNKVWYIQAQTDGVTDEQETCKKRSLQTTNIVSSNQLRERFQCAMNKLADLTVCFPQAETKITSSRDKTASEHHTDRPEDKTPKQTSKLKRPRVHFRLSSRSSPYIKESRPLPTQKSKCANMAGQRGKKSVLHEIMEEEEARRERQNRRDNWLQPGIIVRIVTDKYGKQNNRKRCRIVGMVGPYTAVGHVMSTDDVLTIDQIHLRTSLPNLGGLVRIVNGAYRDEKGVVEKVWTLGGADFKCSVKLVGSPLSGRSLECVSCDDVSEMYTG